MMSYRWDELTVADFGRAVEDAKGVCLVPVGVFEKHGGHLPLGTDCFTGEDIARRTVEREPAVLFPVFSFGQIHEAKHWPGTIAIKTPVILSLLENLCEEIARNGMRKIVLLNGHGGNEHLLSHFVMTMLERQRDYAVYVIRLRDYYPDAATLKAIGMETEYDGHGGEIETSMQLAVDARRVKMDQIDVGQGTSQHRLRHLPGGFTSMFWYAEYPNHYAGDARPASVEKGERAIQACVDSVVSILRAIKNDGETLRLQREFYSRLRH